MLLLLLLLLRSPPTRPAGLSLCPLSCVGTARTGGHRQHTWTTPRVLQALQPGKVLHRRAAVRQALQNGQRVGGGVGAGAGARPRRVCSTSGASTAPSSSGRTRRREQVTRRHVGSVQPQLCRAVQPNHDGSTGWSHAFHTTAAAGRRLGRWSSARGWCRVAVAPKAAAAAARAAVSGCAEVWPGWRCSLPGRAVSLAPASGVDVVVVHHQDGGVGASLALPIPVAARGCVLGLLNRTRDFAVRWHPIGEGCALPGVVAAVTDDAAVAVAVVVVVVAAAAVAIVASTGALCKLCDSDVSQQLIQRPGSRARSSQPAITGHSTN